MKKVLAVMVSFALLSVMTACGSSNGNIENDQVYLSIRQKQMLRVKWERRRRRKRNLWWQIQRKKRYRTKKPQRWIPAKRQYPGKTIWPLCTHEGSGLGRSESDIADLAPDAELSEGLAIRGSNAGSAQADVEAWISGLKVSE